MAQYLFNCTVTAPHSEPLTDWCGNSISIIRCQAVIGQLSERALTSLSMQYYGVNRWLMGHVARKPPRSHVRHCSTQTQPNSILYNFLWICTERGRTLQSKSVCLMSRNTVVNIRHDLACNQSLSLKCICHLNNTEEVTESLILMQLVTTCNSNWKGMRLERDAGQKMDCFTHKIRLQVNYKFKHNTNFNCHRIISRYLDLKQLECA